MTEKIAPDALLQADNWTVITDDVMGGLSEAAVAEVSGDCIVFSGVVSLENNGGFASMRYTGTLPDLTDYRGFKIGAQCDGKTYQLRAHTESAERGHAFKCDFETTRNESEEIELPFSDFVLSAHGQLKPEAGKLNPAEIHQISILISGGQSGEFTFKLMWLGALN